MKRSSILKSALKNCWEVCAELIILEIILDISKVCMNLVQLCTSRMCVERDYWSLPRRILMVFSPRVEEGMVEE